MGQVARCLEIPDSSHPREPLQSPPTGIKFPTTERIVSRTWERVVVVVKRFSHRDECAEADVMALHARAHNFVMH